MESIAIPRNLFNNLLMDFEKLLNDFEQIAEQDTMKVAEKRLEEIKTGKVKTLTEKDFIGFVKKEGVNV